MSRYSLGQAAAPGTSASNSVDDLAKLITATGGAVATNILANKGVSTTGTVTSTSSGTPTSTSGGSNMGLALLVGAGLVGLAVWVATRPKAAPKRRRRR